MSQKQRGLFAVATLLIGALIISSCTFSLSQKPAATPTLIPTGLFVSPFPSVENPMQLIEEFARETAAAQTTIASGGTPPATVLTVQSGSTPTPTPTGTQSTPTNNVVVACTAPPACPAGQSLICGSGSCAGGCGMVCAPNTAAVTSVPVGKPDHYTLQKDEFPYCIARRFNLEIGELLKTNQLTLGDIYLPGFVLDLTRVSSPFIGTRALRAHPETYSVTGNSDTTVYGVACKYGDVDPAAIAQLNGISISANLSIGQPVKIP